MLIPTPRLLLLATAGVLPIVLFGSAESALYIALFWLGGVVLLAAIDARFAPGSRDLTWERSHDVKLSLGAWNPVTLILHNRSRRPVIFQARDSVPRYLLPAGEAAAGVCPATADWSFGYRVYPVHRGDYSFGPVACRYLGPLRLVWRQRAYAIEDEVKVYPDLLAVRSYEALVRRGQLEQLGLRSARQWGAGTEFERLRDYSPDDEYRRISWTATARRGSPIAVDYQVERSQNVMLLLDAGRLMSTRVALEEEPRTPGTDGQIPRGSRDLESQSPPRPAYALTRLDYALNAALLLAYVSIEYGDRVGLLAFTDRVMRYLAPAPGRRQFLTIAELLYNLVAEPTETSYDSALGYLAARNPRRSLAVLFTDIADGDAATSLVARAAHLARRHLPLVVTIRDPDIERVARAVPADVDAVYERAVAGRVLGTRDETLRRLRQGGILTVDTPADKLSPSVINRYLEVKGRGRL